MSRDELTALAAREVADALPGARGAALLRATVVREKQATFSLAPGQPARPGTRTPIEGLFLAGDWIDTGLPGTIESAVVSGHRAASNAIADSDCDDLIAAVRAIEHSGIIAGRLDSASSINRNQQSAFMKSIIVHYQEIALKGNNRPWFIARLARNLRRGDERTSACARCASSWGGSRSCSDTAPTGTRSGIASRGCSASRTSRRPDARRSTWTRSRAAILEDLGDRTARTFRVSARRADKRFPLTSPEIEREVGGRIKEARGWHVDSRRIPSSRSTSRR